MKLRLLASVGLLLCLRLENAQAQGAAKASVDGVVLRLGTDAPLFRATVRIRGSGAPLAVTTTDARGRFAFTNLDPGEYRLEFALNGYAAQEFGQQVFPGQGTPIKLIGDQSLSNLVMRLTPTGTVSGRLLDENGQPLGNVPVQLMRQHYVFRGVGFEKQFDAVESTRTNDRGEYRLFFITPGRYVLTAGNPRLMNDISTPAASGYRENVGLTYYPGVLNAADARFLNVRSGEELSGLDMLVGSPRVYSVRGRVVDARTGAPPAAVSLSLSSEDRQLDSQAVYTAATGAFQFNNVPEGRYTAVAGVRAQGTTTGLAALTAGADAAGFAPIVVAGGNLGAVTITLESGIPLSGRIRVEGTNVGELASLRVWLLPTPDSIPAVTNAMRLLPESNVDAAGTFQFNHVWNGYYRFQVLRLPEGWYVKQARLGEQDALKGPLQIPTRAESVLEVLLSSNTAEVHVSAVDAMRKPVSGAQLVLVPTQRDRTVLFFSETADASGLAIFKNVVPENYTLIAWEAIEDNTWFDPEVLKEAESFGKKLTIPEGGQITTEIAAIPAP